MALLTLITIGGTAMPQPSKYNVTRYDADGDGTGRSETFALNRERIYSGAYKISVAWSALVKADFETAASLLSAASFTVVFLDPFSDTGTKYTTKTMYAGNRVANMLINKDTAAGTYWELSCDLIDYCEGT